MNGKLLMSFYRTWVSIAILLGIGACASLDTDDIAGYEQVPPIKSYLTRDFHIGAAINPAHAFHNGNHSFEERYRTEYARHLSIMTDDWAMKMEEQWVGPYQYNFTYGDETAIFAFQNGLKIRGHTLVWGGVVPEWLETGGYAPSKVEAMVEAYIKAVVVHYQENFPGTFVSWDVVNEPLEEDGTIRTCFFTENLGSDYINKVFSWVKEVVEPGILLFINEYGIEEEGPKLDGLLNLIASLKTDSVPIDAIGFQTHITISEDDLFSITSFKSALDQVIATGLKVMVTELDVRINDDQSGLSDEKLGSQADLFSSVASSALERYPNCIGLVMWGLTDRDSWINNHVSWLDQSEDWPHPFNTDFAPKPSYYSLVEALKQ